MIQKKQRKRDIDTHRHTHRDTNREAHRETHRETHTETHTETHKQRGIQNDINVHKSAKLHHHYPIIIIVPLQHHFNTGHSNRNQTKIEYKKNIPKRSQPLYQPKTFLTILLSDKGKEYFNRIRMPYHREYKQSACSLQIEFKFHKQMATPTTTTPTAIRSACNKNVHGGFT